MRKTVKVYVSIVMAILILYAASLGVSYNNNKTAINEYYHQDMDTMAISLYEYYESDYVLSPEGFLNEFNQRSQYPYRLVMYDDAYNEIGRTGSVIRFCNFYGNEQYCFIDDYLTDEILEQIVSNQEKGNWECSFSYVIEDDKIIPVEMGYKNTKAEVIDTVVFTDKIPEYSLDTPTFSLNLDMLYYDDYAKKCYDYMDELIDSGEAYNRYNDAALGEYELDEFYLSSQVSFLEEDSVDDEDYKEYRVFLMGKIDLDDFALNSYQFKNNVKVLTAVYFAAAVVICTAAYFIMKKHQLNAARYAFTNAAAHELKTPLAVIENQCEFILEGVNEEKNLEYTQSIYNQTLRMSSLLNNLLRYNKLSTLSKIDKEAAELSSIINTEIEKYSAFAETKEIKLTVDLEQTEINCNTELLALVIDNFLSNAIKFSRENTEIKIILHNKKLSVINSSYRELSKNIWDMLYTEDEAREDKSSGMGLPISKVILNLHHYKYGFECKNGTVEFYFIAK